MKISTETWIYVLKNCWVTDAVKGVVFVLFVTNFLALIGVI